MEYEWGPWIEHGGKGCPVEGQLVIAVEATGFEECFIAGSIGNKKYGDAWFWSTLPPASYKYRIIRYRVRRPRVAEWLQEQTQDIPAPERQDA